MLEFPIEFFDDEIRDGFYVPSIMKHNWAAQMEMVNTVDAICKKNNIKYYIFSGTLMGAVRHGGFIPWDDDMDICMLRKDYMRFIKVMQREMPDRYKMKNCHTDPEYRDVFTRLQNDTDVGMNEEFWKKGHGFVCNAGIDVFPLDYIPSNPARREVITEQLMHLQYLIKKYDENGLNTELENKIRIVENEFKVNIKRDETIPQQLYILSEEILCTISRGESNAVQISLNWAQDDNMKGIDIDCFKETIQIPFEVAQFNAPYLYDKLLCSMYSNYMNPVRVCDIHNYPWYQPVLDDIRRIMNFREYPFIRNLLPEENRHELWEQKLKSELSEYVSLFAKASELAEKSFNAGDVDTGNMLLEKCRTLADNAEKIDKKLNGTGKERVIFLTWKAQYWKSLEPYYMQEMAAGNEVLVVPIPYTRLTEVRTRTEEYIETEGFPEYVGLTDFSQIDFEEVRISRIYTQNPYDGENGAITLRQFFYTTNIRQYTDELIYIPWFELDEYDENDERAMYMMQFFVKIPGIVAVDKVILPKSQEWIRKFYISELIKWAGEDTGDIWEKKIIVSDISVEEGKDVKTDSDKSGVKKLLYYIGTSQTIADTKLMLAKLKENLEIFDNISEKISVTLYIESGFIDAIQKYKSEFIEEINEIFDLYVSKEWCELIKADRAIDINDHRRIDGLVGDVDAFYGDAGILMHIFTELGKPVMLQNINI